MCCEQYRPARLVVQVALYKSHIGATCSEINSYNKPEDHFTRNKYINTMVIKQHHEFNIQSSSTRMFIPLQIKISSYLTITSEHKFVNVVEYTDNCVWTVLGRVLLASGESIGDMLHVINLPFCLRPRREFPLRVNFMVLVVCRIINGIKLK